MLYIYVHNMSNQNTKAIQDLLERDLSFFFFFELLDNDLLHEFLSKSPERDSILGLVRNLLQFTAYFKVLKQVVFVVVVDLSRKPILSVFLDAKYSGQFFCYFRTHL